MGEVRTLTVEPQDAGVRLDRWLRRRWPHLGQGHIHKLAREGQLRVDGARVRAETRLSAGARVRVPPLPDASPLSGAEPISERDAAFARGLVLFEDPEVLVLNKPAGLAVQGGTKTTAHIDRLLGAWGEGEQRPRLTHRLDRDTSGVLILGKNAAAAAKLAGAFANRLARKTYWAIVEGNPRPPSGSIDLSLAKTGQGDRERMTPAPPRDERALAALTEFVTLARAGRRAAWLALRPHTGRTHQLRAHLLAIGHPILGDRKYATASSLAASAGLPLQLHARRLTIPHPSGGLIDFEAPPGPAMEAGFARFGFDAGSAPADPFRSGRAG
ncbi:MAG TPA: RluA family pseudouridine synthase [Caulobacteraceae bacterium]